MSLPVRRLCDISADFVNGSAIDHTWRWRDRTGKKHRPVDMETRHLFYTLRMIWNHTMPFKVGENIRLYHFPSVYTAFYMRQAVRNIAAELCTRTDVKPEWQAELDQMAAYFRTTHQRFFNNMVKGGAMGRRKLETPNG